MQLHILSDKLRGSPLYSKIISENKYYESDFDLSGDYTGTTHLVLWFHTTGVNRIPFFWKPEDFLSTQTTSTTDPVTGETSTTSEEVAALPTIQCFSPDLLTLISSLSPDYVDVMSCSFNETRWVSEAEQISLEYNTTVRYSLDDTGTSTNFVLESHNADVTADYLIDTNFSLRLATSLSIKDGTHTIDGIEWNATTSTYTLTKDIVWTTALDNAGIADYDSYIELGASETFNGSTFTIDLTGVSTNGLFYCSTAGAGTECTVQHLYTTNGTITGSSTIATAGGFIMRNGSSRFILYNCSSTGTVATSYAGLIIGAGCGNGTAQYCRSSGVIGFSTTLIRCGGIVGAGSGSITITDSWTTGEISGQASGGIVGSDNIGTIIIRRCAVFGDMTGISVGGLASPQSQLDMKYCYVVSNVTATADPAHLIGKNGISAASDFYFTGSIATTSDVHFDDGNTTTHARTYSTEANIPSGLSASSIDTIKTGFAAETSTWEDLATGDDSFMPKLIVFTQNSFTQSIYTATPTYSPTLFGGLNDL